MNLYPTQNKATGLRFAVVVGRFNQFVASRLLDACVEELEARGAAADAIDVVWVPGAFEIPQAARVLAEAGNHDGIIALGAVIRGGTSHFDYVCRAVTDGVREVIRDTGIPVAFGVLTTENSDQALARAGGEEGNKGVEAAQAAIEMAGIAERLARRAGPED